MIANVLHVSLFPSRLPDVNPISDFTHITARPRFDVSTRGIFGENDVRISIRDFASSAAFPRPDKIIISQFDTRRHVVSAWWASFTRHSYPAWKPDLAVCRSRSVARRCSALIAVYYESGTVQIAGR